MQIVTETATLSQVLTPLRQQGRSIGLVPTMGALHAGHLSLLEAARRHNDLCVCSVFVNPLQFNNADDLARYPRTLETDAALLEAAGCGVLFAPTVEQMYPEPTRLRLDFGPLETVLEGAFRPGHFNGVGIVVSRLFHLVQPDRAYFGQKDLQQCLVIERLVNDLRFPLELHLQPTLREPDGLAMSSRNRNLTPQERQQAPFIYGQLQQAAALLREGHSVKMIETLAQEAFARRTEFRLDYFSVVSRETLQPLEVWHPAEGGAIVAAAHLGRVRLIDNLLLASS